MKKFISLMICVAMILSSVSAMADSDSLIVNTVKVNVSSGSVTLNDEGNVCFSRTVCQSKR